MINYVKTDSYQQEILLVILLSYSIYLISKKSIASSNSLILLDHHCNIVTFRQYFIAIVTYETWTVVLSFNYYEFWIHNWYFCLMLIFFPNFGYHTSSGAAHFRPYDRPGLVRNFIVKWNIFKELYAVSHIMCFKRF